MHELGIAFHVMKSVEAVAKENDLTKIASVTLELGQVSGVVFPYLQDVWNWAAEKRPLFQGSALKMEEIHAVSICLDCNQTYDTVPQGRICPYCNSEKTELLTGNEMNIKSIEGY